jgi:hypothetical protein
MTWRENLPRSVLDPWDSQGQPVFTPADRRMLWHIEGVLAVTATNDTLREVARDLRDYLVETCDHHWIALSADDCCPAMRQCTWCSYTEVAPGRA